MSAKGPGFDPQYCLFKTLCLKLVNCHHLTTPSYILPQTREIKTAPAVRSLVVTSKAFLLDKFFFSTHQVDYCISHPSKNVYDHQCNRNCRQTRPWCSLRLPKGSALWRTPQATKHLTRPSPQRVVKPRWKQQWPLPPRIQRCSIKSSSLSSTILSDAS